MDESTASSIMLHISVGCKPERRVAINPADIRDLRDAGWYVCGVCGTVDDPESWGIGPDYQPACRCED
jgi:hypothetical protein